MLGILQRWRRRREEQRRKIFSYCDGQRQRSIDPLAVLDALDAHPDFLATRDLPLLDHGDHDAKRNTLAATQAAFGVQPWSEDSPGLTQQETILLLASFLIYISDLKKNGGDTPISSAATAERSTTPTTSDTSAYASTSSEPSGEKQPV